jgi:hypothetical protein
MKNTGAGSGFFKGKGCTRKGFTGTAFTHKAK